MGTWAIPVPPRPPSSRSILIRADRRGRPCRSPVRSRRRFLTGAQSRSRSGRMPMETTPVRTEADGCKLAADGVSDPDSPDWSSHPPASRTRRLPDRRRLRLRSPDPGRRRPHRPGWCPPPLQLRCGHGKYRYAIRDSLEAPDPSGRESKRRSASRHVAHRRGDEHLAGSSLGAYPRRKVDGAADERLAALNRLAGVDPDTDPEWSIRMLCGMASGSVDDGEAAGDRIPCRGKDHVERVAFGSDLRTA